MGLRTEREREDWVRGARGSLFYELGKKKIIKRENEISPLRRVLLYFSDEKREG